MKTLSYFGQPRGGPSCDISGERHFDNVTQMLEWLDKRRRQGEAIVLTHCVGKDLGSDGTRRCYPVAPPHRHKIRLPANKSVSGEDIDAISCDNHLQCYMASGWVQTARLCRHCVTNEALATEGGDICEACLDRITDPMTEAFPATVKEPLSAIAPQPVTMPTENYCANRMHNVHGCLIHTPPGTKFCAYCMSRGWVPQLDPAKNQASKADSRPALKPRVRLLGSSTRPCKNTVGCAGNMTATVQRISEGLKPELWWFCPVCRVRKVAEKAPSVVDPRATPILLESSEMAEIDVQLADASKEPVSSDMADMSLHMRHIAAE